MAIGRGGYNTPAGAVPQKGRGGYNKQGRGGYNKMTMIQGRGGYNRQQAAQGRGGYNWANRIAIRLRQTCSPCSHVSLHVSGDDFVILVWSQPSILFSVALDEHSSHRYEHSSGILRRSDFDIILGRKHQFFQAFSGIFRHFPFDFIFRHRTYTNKDFGISVFSFNRSSNSAAFSGYIGFTALRAWKLEVHRLQSRKATSISRSFLGFENFRIMVKEMVIGLDVHYAGIGQFFGFWESIVKDTRGRTSKWANRTNQSRYS